MFEEISELLRNLLPLLIPIAILQVILLVVALVSLLRKRLPFKDKILWLLLVIIVNLIGPIVYFAAGSHYLDEKIAKREDEAHGYRG
ncbi:MAG: PLD nuclease N-terminal domain-containing protein [Oscillospiraceae bacterium]|nr:PLD nuclease N-terminal domain-containing protein [Oscillospiraceae bacterium]